MNLKKHIFSLVVFSMALTGCDSALRTNQIEKVIQSSFDEYRRFYCD